MPWYVMLRNVSTHLRTKVMHLVLGACNNPEAQNMDRIATARNDNGHTARLGRTGKYYCGKRLDVAYCRCCNGYCGPNAGCNCSACMKLDVKRRRLPLGWLVNSEGYPARVSEGRFYCGRCVMVRNLFCDGYCGPTNGPNCDACQILQRLASTRYHRILTQ